MKVHKKKVNFGGGVLIYITVMITVIFVALAFWWHYLSCVEQARAEAVMNRYMLQSLQGELEREIDGYSIARATVYQSAEEVSSVLIQALSGDDWSYRKHPDKFTEESPVYLLCCGETAIGEVKLVAGETDPMHMGYGTWQSPDVSFDLDQFGQSITVIVPYGCEVFVSGEAVGEDEVEETIGLYPQLSAYEAMITEPNQLMVYQIDGIYVDVAVEYGEGYTMLKSDDPSVYYALPVCEDALAEQLMEYCKGFVKAYVEYTANKNSLWSIQQYMVPDSQLYTELTEASSGLDWGHGVNAEIQSIDVKNFVYYGNVITCEASYSMTRDDGDRSENMRLLLGKTALGWRVITREIF